MAGQPVNGGVAAFVVMAIALPLLLAEFGDWCPWLADRIVRWAARRLREPAACQRYEEEWIANLNEVPGRLGRFIAALGYAIYVPSMRRSISQQVGRTVLAAPGKPPTAYLISSMYAPYLGRIPEVGILLQRLRAAADVNARTKSFYLVGADGIGKTTVATFCAGLLAEVFPDGRLYLSANAMGSIDNGIRDLLLADGVPREEIPSGTVDKRVLLRSRLADRRILLLLDGINPNRISDLLGNDAPCPVLIITSRAPERSVADAQQVLTLRPLTRHQASEVLRRRLRGRLDAEPESFANLITALRGQPLLIGLAAELLAGDPAITVAELLATISDEFVNTHDCGVTAVHMIWQSQPPDARRLLLRLSLLHQADFGAHEAALLMNTLPSEARRLIEDLATKGCFFTAGKPGRYILHPAVHAYTSRLLADEHSPERIQELHDLLKRNGVDSSAN
jgi:hypothetical protein